MVLVRYLFSCLNSSCLWSGVSSLFFRLFVAGLMTGDGVKVLDYRIKCGLVEANKSYLQSNAFALDLSSHDSET